MGIRTDQYIGLNSWALKLLATQPQLLVTIQGTKTVSFEGEPESVEDYFCQRVEPSYKEEEIASVNGAFNTDFFELSRYTFRDGRVFEEFVQAAPWSSGPMYFIALKDAEGNVVTESLWTEEEMSQY